MRRRINAQSLCICQHQRAWTTPSPLSVRRFTASHMPRWIVMEMATSVHEIPISHSSFRVLSMMVMFVGQWLIRNKNQDTTANDHFFPKQYEAHEGHISQQTKSGRMIWDVFQMTLISACGVKQSKWLRMVIMMNNMVNKCLYNH